MYYPGLLLCMVALCSAGVEYEDRPNVAALKALLLNRGWRLIPPNLQIVVNGRELYDVGSLYETPVENHNVDDKLWKCHQLLNCRYAKKFKTFLDYGISYGDQCRRMTVAYDSLICRNYYISIIKPRFDGIIVRVLAALKYLRRLAPNCQFDMEVSQYLDYLKSFYDDTPDMSTWPYINVQNGTVDHERVKRQVLIVQNRFRIDEKLLRIFIENKCRPVPVVEREGGPSAIANGLNGLAAQGQTPHNMIPHIIEKLSEELDEFVRFFDDLGFTLTSEASTSTAPDDVQPETENITPESDNVQPEAENIPPESDNVQPEAENTSPESDDVQPEAENTSPESDDVQPEAENIPPESDDVQLVANNFYNLNLND